MYCFASLQYKQRIKAIYPAAVKRIGSFFETVAFAMKKLVSPGTVHSKIAAD